MAVATHVPTTQARVICLILQQQVCSMRLTKREAVFELRGTTVGRSNHEQENTIVGDDELQLATVVAERILRGKSRRCTGLGRGAYF